MLGILSEDIEHLQDAFLKTIFPAISALLLYAVSVIALGFFSWPFAILLALYLFVLVVLFPVVSLLVTRAKNAKLKSGRNVLYSRLTDAVMGVSDWMFSGRRHAFIDAYEKRNVIGLSLNGKNNALQDGGTLLRNALSLALFC